MLKEVKVKLHEGKDKPELGEIIVFLSKKTGWCLGGYTGYGLWRDDSAAEWSKERWQKTSDIEFWCKVEDLNI